MRSDNVQNKEHPTEFKEVLRNELKELGKDIKDGDNVFNRAHQAKLSGLAFSGGGIRSATFNLGVLQGLAGLGILDKFDYLSTVSGGGYIGSWLAAWIRREYQPREYSSCNRCPLSVIINCIRKFSDQFIKLCPFLSQIKDSKENNEERDDISSAPPSGKDCLLNVIKKLNSSAEDQALEQNGHEGTYNEPKPISHLRDFSNYMTPHLGFWNTDTWTLIVAYVRNFMLTFSTILGVLIATVLLIQSISILYHRVLDISTNSIQCYFIFAAFLLFLAAFAFFISWGDLPLRRAESTGAAIHIKRSFKYSYRAIGFFLVSIWLGAACLWFSNGDKFIFKTSPITIAVIIAVVVILFGLLGKIIAQHGSSAPSTDRTSFNTEDKTKNLFPKIFAAILGFIVMYFMASLLRYWMNKLPSDTNPLLSGDWIIVVLGPLMVLLAFSVFSFVFIGAAASAIEELEREWLTRLFASITKLTILFCLLTALVLYAPWSIEKLQQKIAAYSILGLLWAAISSAGALLGRSSTENKLSGFTPMIKRLLMATAPVIFVIGLFVIIILGLNKLYPLFASNCANLEWNDFFRRLALAFGVGFLSFLWSCRVGVNTFSLHALYGNRLIRAYLGASNPEKHYRQHPLFRFDRKDNNIKMSHLRPGEKGYKGPYLIINAAINLTHSSRLAWQQRKAGSFSFTPLYCGYEFTNFEAKNNNGQSGSYGGYVKSTAYAFGGETGSDGISLGKAMTISGAAASPNMGYHSSPALAFLMTVFNVRLGWWLPNTVVDDKKLWVKEGPLPGLFYLFRELLGWTDEKSRFVYLSDGGHFENLGIYELVRRHTQHIIACDAAADPKMQFGDLGNAIERCRSDFGIPIEIDITQLRTDPINQRSRWHCAVGKIRYSQVDPKFRDGYLFYIKASITGDEPQDIAAYAAQKPQFPQETTADQWFDESQFESYRALGQHIVETVMKVPVLIAKENKAEEDLRDKRKDGGKDKGSKLTMGSLFYELRKQWYPLPENIKEKEIDHNILLSGMLDEMRKDPNLHFLDCQFYPDMEGLIREAKLVKGRKPWVPDSYDELRAGFFFCKRLIQFMQQVYQDLQLDNEYSAPSNRGWMNLFRRWSLSRMLRYTWSMTAGTYTARFQSFCGHHLALEAGQLSFSEPFSVKKYQPVLEKQNQNDDLWRTAEKDYGLDLYETMIIRKFLSVYLYNNKNIDDKSRFQIFPLKITTENPTADDIDKTTKITAGFAIVGPHSYQENEITTEKVIYIRIRPWMRQMGFFRQARKCIKKHTNIPHQIAVPSKDMEIPPSDDNNGVSYWRDKMFREIHLLQNNIPRYLWLEKLNLES